MIEHKSGTVTGLLQADTYNLQECNAWYIISLVLRILQVSKQVQVPMHKSVRTYNFRL